MPRRERNSADIRFRLPLQQADGLQLVANAETAGNVSALMRQIIAARIESTPAGGDDFPACSFTGRAYWPTDPRAADICIEDSACAMSLLCRFGGHCREFYSVAQHSVLVSHYCHTADAMWGLLHDASEAYILDIPRPLKRSQLMGGYRGLETLWMVAVCERFGLQFDMPESVAAADEVLLATELRDLMPQRRVLYVDDPGEPRFGSLANPIAPMESRDAEREFLARFRELTAKAPVAEVAHA